MRGTIFQVAACLLALGCSDAAPESAPPRQVSAPSAFDAASTGSISGQVMWQGDVPPAEMIEMRTDPPVARGKNIANPNHPRIDPANKGVVDAIVFLRGVDAAKARPWDHPPVRVEMRDLALHVRQGDRANRVGIVRAGDAVEFVSRDSMFHALEVRGAAFFSLRFVDPEVIAKRRLGAKGVVDMTSAAGYYWMRAYLLVDDHPYYAHTDSQGRFDLKQVPPGDYRLVCWLPNYRIQRRERDPENGLVTRLVYGPPLATEQPVHVATKQKTEARFTIGAESFGR